MNWKFLAQTSLRSMLRFRLRSFFMSLGVVVGVATLIAGNAVGGGAADRIESQLDQMFGPGTILIGSTELKLEDLEALEEQLNQVVAAAPRLMLGEKEARFSGSGAQAAISGFTPEGEYVWNRGVTYGRYISRKDVDRSERVALIGTGIQAELFGDDSGDVLGQQFTIDGVPFEVIGILEPLGIDPHGDDRDLDVYVPLSTAQRRLANTDVIGNGKLVVENAELVDEDADAVAAILRERFQIAAGEPETFRIYTSKFAGKAVVKAKRMLSVYVMIAAVVVLLVAAVVISSIMLVVVRERIHEIGLRKAIGATPRSIALQFLCESTAVSLISGVVGLALGLAVSGFVAQRFDVPMQFTLGTLVVAVAASVSVGVLSGIIPARRAAALDPIQALQ